MTNYAKSLLPLAVALLLIIFIASLMGSFVLNVPVLVVWFSAVKSVSWMYILFFFIGLWRMYQEVAYARKLKTLTKSKPIKPSSQETIILSGVIFAAFWMVVVVLAYVSGNKDTFLDLIFVLMAGGTGLLIILTMMIIGIILGRLIK